jgi:hypothetical protein
MTLQDVEIRASVYHLGTDTLNSFINLFTDKTGIYHVGIEMLGVEWSYGYCEEGCGIFAVEPGKCSLGPFKESVHLGRSQLDVDKIIKVLHELSLNWIGRDYDIANKNCVVFSSDLLNKILPNGHLPSYAAAMTNIGQSIYGKSTALGIAAKRVKRRDIFGSSKQREEMWLVAEQLMREAFYGPGFVPPNHTLSNMRPSIRHSLCDVWSMRTDVGHTELVCSRAYYRVTQAHVRGYSGNATTRHLLGSIR